RSRTWNQFLRRQKRGADRRATDSESEVARLFWRRYECESRDSPGGGSSIKQEATVSLGVSVTRAVASGSCEPFHDAASQRTHRSLDPVATAPGTDTRAHRRD